MLPNKHGLPVPELPSVREWSTAEHEQWQQWWESPQAGRWDESYVPTVAVMLTYYGHILTDTATREHFTEYRQLATSLGLTADGMKRLGWTFEGDE
ncbi:hypothetical protein [Streptomyces sp. NPDC048142]|uniref:phage terminase small subunit n=1 Tax=Streptomyces sp. NPDC048142 TaxID=3365501 RepID=UPI003723587D